MNRQKSLSLCAYGIWRWKLMTASDAGEADLLGSFLTTAIRWLTTGEDERLFRVETTREFFTQGEPVEFTAQLYDQTAQPIDGAEVKVAASRGEKTLEVQLVPRGNGRYDGAMYGLEQGDYRFTAHASSAGTGLGDDRGRFSVGELNREFRDTRMDAGLLRRLASVTGGRFLRPAEVETITGFLSDRPSFAAREVEQKFDIQLWNWIYTMALAVALLVAEWLLRKQSGMV
jgi:hypothetical protein